MLHAPAMERWISARQPGSPLSELFRRYPGMAGDEIEKAITRGLGTGRGITNTTRAVVQEIGDAMPEWKVARTVRTEMMRAYRGAQIDSYEALNAGIGEGEDYVVRGYYWVTAGDDGVCPACLAMEELGLLKTWPSKFHPNCRCTVIPAVDPRILKRPAFSRPRGEAWLREQPEHVQRRILGSDERYELWKQGVPLREMMTSRWSPGWGETVGVRPLGELRALVPEVKATLRERLARGEYRRPTSHDEAAAFFRELEVEVSFGEAPLDVVNVWVDGYADHIRRGLDVPTRLTFEHRPEIDAIASYRYGEQGLHVNLSDPFWGSPGAHMAGYFARKWFSSSDIQHIVRHEIAHYLHIAKILNDLRLIDSFTAAEKERIRKEVSRYAATNPVELIAEVFANQTGPNRKELSEFIWEIYRGFRGPAIP